VLQQCWWCSDAVAGKVVRRRHGPVSSTAETDT
jgi:hypothetical protein